MSTIKTTVKTETCSYTEFRIYPGRGVRYIAKDGKVHVFINSKADSLFHQRIKPVKLTWTQSWRRMNKKLRTQDGGLRRKTRRTAKVQKAIIGLSLDDIKKKHAMKKEVPGARAAALKEARERQKGRQEAAPKAKVTVVKQSKAATTVPKLQKSAKTVASAGSKRR